MFNDCCSKAMREVEGSGGSKGFLNHGTDEKGDRLVTSYECVGCKDRWLYEVQTQAPDKKEWFPVDQSRFS